METGEIGGSKRHLYSWELIQVRGDDVDDPNTYLVTFDDKAARYLVITPPPPPSHLLLFLLE